MYTRPVSIERQLEEASNLDLDKIFHFLTFFLLGVIAQLTNNKKNEYTYAVTLALIISLFIEFTHFIIPYRDFEILDGVFNIIGCITGITIIYYYRIKT
jgi:VanZ family protein